MTDRTEKMNAEEIQREIDFMRAMYARRRSLNHPRHEAMVGWCLVGVGVAVPVLVAVLILFL